MLKRFFRYCIFSHRFRTSVASRFASSFVITKQPDGSHARCRERYIFTRKKWIELTRPFVWAKAFSQEYSSSQFEKKITVFKNSCCAIAREKIGPLHNYKNYMMDYVNFHSLSAHSPAEESCASFAHCQNLNRSFIYIFRQCKGIAQIDMDFVYLGASLTLS